LKVAEEYDRLAVKAAFYELQKADGPSTIPDPNSDHKAF
jgi:hypothetical protein